MEAVLVMILNYQRPDDTIECIRSLLHSEKVELDITVIDNGSKDDSVAQLRTEFPDLQIVTIQENTGFVGGMNVAIKTALGSANEWVILVSNDTVFEPEAIYEMVSSVWDVAIPKILFYDRPEIIWSAGAYLRKFPPMVMMRGFSKPDSKKFNDAIPLKYATGCVLAARRIVLTTVGGYNIDYENYMEDYEFFSRVGEANFNIGYVPSARVYHKVSRTLGDRSPRQYFYLGRNYALFYLESRKLSRWNFLIIVLWFSIREVVHARFRLIKYFLSGVFKGLDLIKNRTETSD